MPRFASFQDDARALPGVRASRLVPRSARQHRLTQSWIRGRRHVQTFEERGISFRADRNQGLVEQRLFRSYPRRLQDEVGPILPTQLRRTIDKAALRRLDAQI